MIVAKEKLSGMGAICSPKGIGFRVWAPNADMVGVIGSFQKWDIDNPVELEREEEGYWYGFSSEGKVGDEYKYLIANGEQKLQKVDPYAKRVTNSAGNGIIYDPGSFDWSVDDYSLPPITELVIYELHIGTFAGDFEQAKSRLKYLQALGVNVIEVMPVTEFAGDTSWGYNPAHIFSVESTYGGANEFKEFILAAHQLGIGVILDVVYNHLGPSDLDLWNFDGSGGDGGGPYFYNDERAKTPWGDTRPNYECNQVRQFLRDNLLMWFQEYNIDGVRTDGTLYVRREDLEAPDLPEGWSLLQWLTKEAHSLERPRLMIAEDLQNDDWLTKPESEGGAGFDAQWDGSFCHQVRELLSSPEDSERHPARLAAILKLSYNGDPFQSVIYTESHDEVANGKARVPSEVDSENPQGDHAQARSLLGIALVLTAPGVPMMFQEQERLASGWFQDTEQFDWSPEGRDRDALHVVRDFIHLRTGRNPQGAALSTGDLEVLGAEDDGLLWIKRGRENPLFVVYNLKNQTQPLEPGFAYEIVIRTGPRELGGEIEPYGVVVFRGGE
jgi:1,4-alpha-glucan branching enzyme